MQGHNRSPLRGALDRRRLPGAVEQRGRMLLRPVGIFHGKQGCTLDRSLRSDVCNSYFCGGLLAYLTGDEVVIPTMVIAGAGDNMRTSPILMP
jgi:hypothetical protein